MSMLIVSNDTLFERVSAVGMHRAGVFGEGVPLASPAVALADRPAGDDPVPDAFHAAAAFRRGCRPGPGPRRPQAAGFLGGSACVRYVGRERVRGGPQDRARLAPGHVAFRAVRDDVDAELVERLDSDVPVSPVAVLVPGEPEAFKVVVDLAVLDDVSLARRVARPGTSRRIGNLIVSKHSLCSVIRDLRREQRKRPQQGRGRFREEASGSAGRPP